MLLLIFEVFALAVAAVVDVLARRRQPGQVYLCKRFCPARRRRSLRPRFKRIGMIPPRWTTACFYSVVVDGGSPRRWCFWRLWTDAQCARPHRAQIGGEKYPITRMPVSGQPAFARKSSALTGTLSCGGTIFGQCRRTRRIGALISRTKSPSSRQAIARQIGTQ